MTKIFNVFQSGLVYGAKTITTKEGKKKRYAFVKHPIEGWCVFLRTCVFLHEIGKPFDPLRFIVVKRTGAYNRSLSWEPPKGQAERGDHEVFNTGTPENALTILTGNAIRETEEESHIKYVKNLKHTGFVFQSQETEYPDNTYFQYHIYRGFVEPSEIMRAFDMFAWIKGHPRAFARFKSDRREKDDIAWFTPTKTPLTRRWMPSILSLYISSSKKGSA